MRRLAFLAVLATFLALTIGQINVEAYTSASDATPAVKVTAASVNSAVPAIYSCSATYPAAISEHPATMDAASVIMSQAMSQIAAGGSYYPDYTMTLTARQCMAQDVGLITAAKSLTATCDSCHHLSVDKKATLTYCQTYTTTPATELEAPRFATGNASYVTTITYDAYTVDPAQIT